MTSIAAARLAGKVALITGGAQGIGLGIAVRLAKEGARIALNVYRDDERARSARDTITALGVECATFPADVGQTGDVAAMVAAVRSTFGRIDLLVNNAGIERHAGLFDVTEDGWDAVLRTNLKGPFFLARAFAAQARDAGHGGSIINVSSVHEELPFPNFIPYSASKGGLKMLMRTMAIELAPLNITVNNVAPGAIRTPINAALLEDQAKTDALVAQIPARRLGEPADVAGAVAFLASDDARYITGSTVVVDGGLMWNYQEQ